MAKKLLFIGSIKDEIIVDNEILAQELLKMIEEKYPGLAQKRFGEDLSLEAISKRRGYLISKDEYDLERTATAIIDDFRKGRIGKITLD